jgi:hypothetical protein
MPSDGTEHGDCLYCANPEGLPECGQFKHHDIHAVWCLRPVGHDAPHATCGTVIHPITTWREFDNVLTSAPWAQGVK